MELIFADLSPIRYTSRVFVRQIHLFGIASARNRFEIITGKRYGLELDIKPLKIQNK